MIDFGHKVIVDWRDSQVFRPPVVHFFVEFWVQVKAGTLVTVVSQVTDQMSLSRLVWVGLSSLHPESLGNTKVAGSWDGWVGSLIWAFVNPWGKCKLTWKLFCMSKLNSSLSMLTTLDMWLSRWTETDCTIVLLWYAVICNHMKANRDVRERGLESSISTSCLARKWRQWEGK